MANSQPTATHSANKMQVTSKLSQTLVWAHFPGEWKLCIAAISLYLTHPIETNDSILDGILFKQSKVIYVTQHLTFRLSVKKKERGIMSLKYSATSWKTFWYQNSLALASKPLKRHRALFHILLRSSRQDFDWWTILLRELFACASSSAASR